MNGKIFFFLVLTATVSFAQTSTIPVTFYLNRTLLSNEVGIGLNGTFNNWGNNSDGTGSNKHLIPLTDNGSNLWTVTINVPAAVYAYKFITYSVNAGDTIVDVWITDPDNPKVDGSGYNNSIINVKDPMIYYVTPLDGSTINNFSSTISAKISWADSSDVTGANIGISVDNFSLGNTGQYFDKTSRVISYTPTPFTFTTHSVMITVRNSHGSVDTAVSTFKVVNQIIAAPYTFYFDPGSPNLQLVGKLNSISVKGLFNSYGSDPLSGPDSDGVYSITEQLAIGVPFPYQYIINGGQYIDDPDNPLMTSDFETIAIKHVISNPYFNVVSPRQGQVFAAGNALSIGGYLMMSDSGKAIDKSSIAVYLDGSPISIAAVDSVAGGVSFQTGTFTPAQGRHQLRFFGSDIGGNSTTSYLTFGSFQPNSGFHYIDADLDDNGPGNYKYPSFSPSGSADIKEIDIDTNATDDSLVFNIEMASISDYTRMSFEIVNSLGDSLIMDPNKAGIQIPDFADHGVYFILAAPNSSVLAGTENQIYAQQNIYSPSVANIAVNSDAKASGIFRFGIPISLLESTMGTFAKGCYFIAYSYLGNTNGAWKVTQTYGGSLFDEQPNIYDGAFFYNSQIEKRNLANFNYSFNNGGSRYVKLASNRRGALLIMPGDISSSLANKPYVKILTDGGDIRWSDTIKVYVAVSDSSAHTGTLSVGGTNYDLDFSSDTASVNITLLEGINQLQASVPYGSGQTSYSTKVYFDRIKDHEPAITIVKGIPGGTASLDGSGTTNPDGLPMTFAWSQDRANPQAVNFSSTTSSSVTFSAPTAKGDYFFTVTCSTSKDTSYQRVALVVDSSGNHFPDISNWHASWIDSAVIYEVYVKTFSLDGDFTALTNRIQQIKNLGINVIWLMPIHPTPQLSPSNPGYAIENYFAVNPQYGSFTDFKTFVDSAHANGIRVMMDYVVNHTHNTHGFMLDAMKYGMASPYHGFYDWNPDGTYQYMFTWTDLPSISYDGPDSARNMNYLINMAKFWMENYRVDGFRCDVAWGINDTRRNGPEFWQKWRQALKTIKPDAFLLGELDAMDTSRTYFDKKFDAGYDYSTINALRNALSNNTLIPQLGLVENYYASPSYPSYAVPMKYIENHDEPRFISQYNPAETKAAATIEFTLPGVPLIYAGQEVGETTQRGLVTWTDPNGLLPFYQKLVSYRHKFKALEFGKYLTVNTTAADTVFAFARVSDTLPAIVAANLTGGRATFALSIDSTTFNMAQSRSYYLNDLMSGSIYPVSRTTIGNFTMTLAPYQTAVMILADTAFVTSVQEPPNIATKYELLQNYPNPFNPSTIISYQLPVAGHVTLKVYDVLGREVKTLVDEAKQPGRYEIRFDGSRLASGVYFYVLKTNTFFQAKKMLMIK
ncbi:MAG TPA: alpha-amylase family glycosyl hydrolase [Candidatus Acidoferrales bacterium]|nr:alpha-amylase family glycosyl hydrolase [Candidatus Acidoferrales bacterium]